MSSTHLYLLFYLFFAVDTASSSTVLTSATVTVNNQTASTVPKPPPSISLVGSSPSIATPGQASSQTFSAVVAATTAVQESTQSVAPSSVQSTDSTSSSAPLTVTPSLSSMPSPSLSSPVGQVSPTSTVHVTASAGTEPTEPTETTTGMCKLCAKGKTIGGLAVVGIVLAGILGLSLAAFAIYYFFFRKKMFPDFYGEALLEAPTLPAPAAATKTASPEVGITHQAFEGDPGSSPTEATAPEPEVKGPESEVPEVKPEVNENEEGEKDAGFSQDSAL